MKLNQLILIGCAFFAVVANSQAATSPVPDAASTGGMLSLACAGLFAARSWMTKSH